MLRNRVSCWPMPRRHIVRRGRAEVSKYMSLIRSQDNEPERRLRAAASGVRRRFLTNVKGVPGTPDVAFLRQRVALFVDGCFWHRCPKCYVRPSVNTAYWIAKADRNRRRDQRVNRALHRDGWSIVRLRECDLEKNPVGCRERIVRAFARARTRKRHGAKAHGNRSV